MTQNLPIKFLKKVINFLKKILCTNNLAKLLTQVRFNIIIDPNHIQPVELQFVKDIIDFLYIQKDKYETLTKDFYSMDGDDEELEKAVYIQKVTNLLSAIV